ncbi:hypothetical protein K3152_00520 [Qipengyuania sp. 1NDH17]|uniref:Tetratricopeptide repeat protein n=1 Tax=Qipengyuania polymorpha TaxID=2867234 RepID=A0ABS7IWT3_9SPHN|nr:tetratricopeptide repeat protein [Qipengyuania polymorpha]MBX7456720.1 hypothetical protein [Qipengyuania polymorpha]
MNIRLIAPLALALATAAHAHDGEGHAASEAAGKVGAEYMVMEVSANAAAAEPFLRGLALLHNFEYGRAAEAFEQARLADPDFVMAYWGEAMTYNHPLWEQQDRDKALEVLARLGPTPKARRAKARTPREAMWLDAVETLYGEGTKEERDFLYLDKMQALHESDPADIDARAFTGLAMLGTSHGGRQVPLYMKAAGLLEPGFSTHEMHPGILHYLIHSYDDPVHAPLGARMAERYAVVAPDAGHAQHMVSHIFHALGDWEASERANILADAVVDRQRAERARDASDCGHYNEWLVYSLLQQGKDASERVSRCRAQALAAIEAGSDRKLGYGAASSYTTMALWQGVLTDDWPEALPIDGDSFLSPQFDMATARLLAGRRDAAAARAALADMKTIAAAMEAALAKEDELNTYTMPWTTRQIAQGEALVALAEGREAEALTMLEAAGAAEAALPEVFGPPPMTMPSYEMLGLELMLRGRKEEAAAAFDKALALAPGRRLSLQGLEMARPD